MTFQQNLAYKIKRKSELLTFSIIPRQRRQILYKSVFYKISAENKQNIELILY